jgi:CheY-like chemotaxis protein
MKILYFEPRMDAGTYIVESLKAKGYALLHATTAQEASQLLKLHGRSVELAIIHRESAYGTGDPGLRFVATFKAEKENQDLPYILTTGRWTDADCAAHQSTPQGANAYLSGMGTLGDLNAVSKRIHEAIVAVSKVDTPTTPPPAPSPGRLKTKSMEIPKPAFSAAPELNEVVLQDVEPLFTKKESTQTGTSSIRLELPAGFQSAVTPPPSTDAVEHGGLTSLRIESDPEPFASTPAVHAQSSEISQEMPYLMQKNSADERTPPPPKFVARGDAVIPGGAQNAPDVETLKHYLELREQDVAALSAQIRGMKEQWAHTQEQLKAEQARAKQMEFDIEAMRKQLDAVAEARKAQADDHQRTVDTLQNQLKQRLDKVKTLESKIGDAQREIEAIRERVRSDLQKIRVREKELENKLEVTKKDAELLLASRENKIVELKRRLDIAEYNLDLAQERHVREKERAEQYRTKLAKASQAMKAAEDMLEESGGA